MKNTKKVAAVTLALLSLIASCTKGSDPTSTNPVTPGSTPVTPSVPSSTPSSPASPSIPSSTPVVMKQYDVTLPDSIEHVQITADKTKAYVGEDVTFTITLSAGYRLDKFTVNQAEVAVTQDQAKLSNMVYAYTATVKMVENGLSAFATTTKAVYNVTIEAGMHATLTADKQTASIGDDIVFTLAVDAGYKASVSIMGEPVTFTGNTYTYTVAQELGDYGVFASYNASLIYYSITPSTVENGRIAVLDGDGYAIEDLEGFVVGDSVTVKVFADKGYYVDTVTIDGVAQSVKANQADQSYELTFSGDNLKDHTVSATFTNERTVSTAEELESLRTTIEAADSYAVRLGADITLTKNKLPLAVKDTSYNFNGHKITADGSVDGYGFWILNAGDYYDRQANIYAEAWQQKSITLKNGTIYQKSKSLHILDVSALKKCVIDTMTIENDATTKSMDASSAIQCTGNTDLQITNSKVTYYGAINGAYAITTNALEGGELNGQTSIKNSAVTVTSDDKDNTALLLNTNKLNVSIDNSTFTGDRQAVFARTGTWAVNKSSFVTTGAWLAIDSNKAIDATRKAGTWGQGNEAPSAAFVAGDERDTYYNVAASFTFTGGNKFTSNGAASLSIHSDGVYTTTVTMDAITAMNSYADEVIDDTATTTVTKNNFLKKTVAELNAMTASDSNNIYYVTGVLTKITNTQYGNAILRDSTTGDELVVYGSYLTNAYSVSNGTFSMSTSSATVLPNDYVGKEVTLAGVFKYYVPAYAGGTNTPELENSVLIDSSGENVTGSVTVAEGITNGSISVDKNSPKFGEEVTVTVTPAEGYQLASLTVTNHEGVTSNINTATYKFKASLSDTVNATFETASEYETKSVTVNYSDFTGVSSAAKIEQTVSGFKFTISNGTITGGQLRIYQNNSLTITPATNGDKLKKIVFTCTANGTAKYGPGNFKDDAYTYEDNGRTGTWESASGVTSLSLTASSAQVRITKIDITYLSPKTAE